MYYFFLSAHLFSIFVWISSIFYLYRLNLMHINQNNRALLNEAIFTYKKVASPALLTAIILGVTLISSNKSLLETGLWIYIKFFLISLMILMHFQYKIDLKAVSKNLKTESRKVIVYHIYSIFMMLAFVIFLTITKPF